MIKKILLAVAVVIVLLLGYVAFLAPTHFRIARSIDINAPATVVFPHINTLRKFHEWNPWIGLDPSAKYAFEGPLEGVGAINTWDGNDKVGAGRMEIVESQPVSLIKMKLIYERPFKSTADVAFDIKPNGATTTVTWVLEGENTFLPRLMCVFMNMDKMVGEAFTRGLTQLKKISEGEAAQASGPAAPAK